MNRLINVIGKIAVACDHGGFELKQEIIKYLISQGIDFVDLGSYNLNPVDYPDYAHLVCEAISNGEAGGGILICGTGIGMSMAANKHKGIRAACCSDTYSVKMTRKHNDANILCIGGRVLGSGAACDKVELFLSTEHEHGRHDYRVKLIMKNEEFWDNGKWNS